MTSAQSPKPVPHTPEIAFDRRQEKPIAHVVIRAESHTQLDQMLIALSRAVSAGAGARSGTRERSHVRHGN